MKVTINVFILGQSLKYRKYFRRKMHISRGYKIYRYRGKCFLYLKVIKICISFVKTNISVSEETLMKYLLLPAEYSENIKYVLLQGKQSTCISKWQTSGILIRLILGSSALTYLHTCNIMQYFMPLERALFK